MVFLDKRELKMKKEKISSLQLFYLLIGFEFGTTIILPIGAEAKQDAWLVILIAGFSSLVLMWVYIKLSALYPDQSFVQMLPKLVGKFLAYPFSILYIVYFIYIAGRVCRDFGELIVSTILVETPVIVVIGSFMVLMIYCLRSGIETFGRMSEAVFPVFMLSLIVIWILLLSVDSFTLENLTPIFGNGIKPVLIEIFPRNLIFPYAELFIIFLMFIPFLNNRKNAGKVGFIVIIIGGIFLTIHTVIILSVLGPEIYQQEHFPLLSATRLISIADFLERFDAIIILMMVAGVFFKVGLYTYGAATGIEQLLNMNHNKSILVGLGTIITPLSLLEGRNIVSFLEIGLGFFNFYIQSIMLIIFPTFLLCIGVIRKKLHSNEKI
jgi:spore germination protein KB